MIEATTEGVQVFERGAFMFFSHEFVRRWSFEQGYWNAEVPYIDFLKHGMVEPIKKQLCETHQFT